MKKLLTLLLFCFSLQMMAQQTLVITGSDGTELNRIPVWKLGDIKFESFEKPTTIIGTAVDLGLKSQVKWSNINLGAEDPLSTGFLFGWGNYDYSNHSTDLKFFPATIAGTNIVSTTNDIAQYYWGGEWRMPTVKDFEDLLSLDWKWEAENNAYRVSNPEDEEQFIYLPLTGFAFGEDTLEADSAYYWTGDIAPEDSATYVRFAGPVPDANSPAELLSAFRARRFAVRPVYGKYVLPVAIVAAEAEVSANTATVDVTLTGGGTNIKYGLLFGTNESLTVGDGQTEPITETVADLDELGNELKQTFNLTTLLGEELAYETTYYYQAYVEVGNDRQWEAEKHSFTTEGLTIVANDASVSANTATVDVTVRGSGKDIDCVLLFGRNESLSEEGGQTKVFKQNISELNGYRNISFNLTELLGEEGGELEYETTYYYRFYLQKGSYIKWDATEPHSFTTEVDRRLVDLGLSVKWARWDIGASEEYEYGNAYAWGCTDLNTYITTATGNISGDKTYDVARKEWGDEWRMPTKDEWEELFTYCQAESYRVKDKNNNIVFGVKFSRRDAWRDGKQLDDYLFIPYCGIGKIHEYRGNGAFYWTATNIDASNAYHCMFMNGAGEILSDGIKITPRNVRAVYGDGTDEIVKDGGGNGDGNGGGNGGGNNGGDNPGGGGDDTPVDLPDLDESTFGAVDLGLTSGTLWANMNVGAEHTYDTGNYYAWGETEPKEQYTPQNYAYCTVGENQFGQTTYTYARSPYLQLSGHAEYDPATQIEGGNWVMPTREQFEELIAECTWERVEGLEKYNNIPGCIVTSKKYPSKSIFFPAVNRWFKKQPAYGKGYYWTATYNGADDEHVSAYAVLMDPSNNVPAAIGKESRYYGMPIRPVQNKK